MLQPVVTNVVIAVEDVLYDRTCVRSSRKKVEQCWLSRLVRPVSIDSPVLDVVPVRDRSPDAYPKSKLGIMGNSLPRLFSRSNATRKVRRIDDCMAPRRMVYYTNLGKSRNRFRRNERMEPSRSPVYRSVSSIPGRTRRKCNGKG